MRFHETVLLLAVMPVVLFSCSKEKSNEIPITNTTTYLPQTAGSFWHYADTAQNTGFKLVDTDSTKSIEGIHFTYYENIPDATPQDTTYTLMGEDGGDYYISAFLAELGTGKILILKQDGAVGDSWTQQMTYDTTVNLALVFNIVEKGSSKMVNGKAFKDVFHVRLSAQIPLDGSSGTGVTFSVPIGDLYFAAGIGIIELDLTPPEMESQAVHLLLTDYDIR